MPPRNRHEADSQAGFAVGKRVWLKDTWDGALVRHALGHRVEGMVIEKADEAYVTVRLADGEPARVLRDHLRLTPPPSATGKAVKPKEPRPPKRKEAIDPRYGYEQTIFDALEG